MEKQFKGIIVVDGKVIRYTACVAERFAHIVDNEHAIACAIVLDYIGAEKIKDDAKRDLFNLAFNSNESIESIMKYIDTIRAPRKQREMSEKSKTKSKVLKLAKIGGINHNQIADICGITENEVKEIIYAEIAKRANK